MRSIKGSRLKIFNELVELAQLGVRNPCVASSTRSIFRGLYDSSTGLGGNGLNFDCNGLDFDCCIVLIVIGD